MHPLKKLLYFLPLSFSKITIKSNLYTCVYAGVFICVGHKRQFFSYYIIAHKNESLDFFSSLSQLCFFNSLIANFPRQLENTLSPRSFIIWPFNRPNKEITSMLLQFSYIYMYIKLSIGFFAGQGNCSGGWNYLRVATSFRIYLVCISLARTRKKRNFFYIARNILFPTILSIFAGVCLPLLSLCRSSHNTPEETFCVSPSSEKSLFSIGLIPWNFADNKQLL